MYTRFFSREQLDVIQFLDSIHARLIKKNPNNLPKRKLRLANHHSGQFALEDAAGRHSYNVVYAELSSYILDDCVISHIYFPFYGISNMKALEGL